jgi:DNA-binding GntR family transcriptional regulator
MTSSSRAGESLSRVQAPDRGLGPETDGRKPDALVSSATLAEAAYAQIRELIISLELPPGAAFSEADLAEQLQLSKTPVREALLRARLEGLVEVQPRAGYRVAPVTLKDARDLCEFRAMLEGEVAAAVATGVASKAVARPALAELESARPEALQARVDDASAFLGWLVTEQRFHEMLSQMTANDRFMECETRVLGEFARLCRLSLALDPRVIGLPHEHGALVAAIEEGNAARARECAIEEVVTAQSCMMDALVSSRSVATVRIELPDERPPGTFYLDVPKVRAEEV